MAEVAVGPPAPEARGLDDGGAPFQRFRARGPERHVAHAGHARGRELERVVFVVVPGTQIDRVASPTTLVMPITSVKNRRLSAGFGDRSSTCARCARSNDRMVGFTAV
jgi:hypothetical protein